MPHTIADNDWSAFRQLLSWWRSTHGRRKLATHHTDQPSTHSDPVVLLTSLAPAASVEAAKLRKTRHYVQDIFLPDDPPQSFLLPIGQDSGTEFFTASISPLTTAAELYDILQLTPLAGKIDRVEFGPASDSSSKSQRWKIVYNVANQPIPRIVNDALQPRLFITDSTWIDSGERIAVEAGCHNRGKLPAGTLCQVSHHPQSQGWIVTEFETFPPPAEATEIGGGDPVKPCVGGPVIPAGLPELCPVCQDDTPEFFQLNSDRLPPEFHTWIADRPNNAANPLHLFHDAGNVFQGDSFGPSDSLHWQLTLYENSSVGPRGKVELIETGNYAATDGLYLLYWSHDPWDCLGRNQARLITHASRNSTHSVRTDWPGCIEVVASGSPCGIPTEEQGGITILQGWRCAPYFQSDFLEHKLVAGQVYQTSDPASPVDADAFGRCYWPPFGADENGELSVGIEFGSTGNSQTPWFYDIKARVRFAGEEYTYEKTSEGCTPNCMPDCGKVWLTSGNSPVPDGWPDRIQLNPWSPTLPRSQS